MTDLSINLYKSMYLMRRAEETIQFHYAEDEMKTPMHMSMGEEAIVAGVCGALKPEDQVLGSYRSHALYLAKTGETDRFFGEMYGRKTGIAMGKAGSMHLSAPDQGLLCCSAIVATSIPVALGVAFANKYQDKKKKVAVFFGDGATEEGAFWESLNAACLMRLPLLFVCEDNEFAIHAHIKDRQAYHIPEAVRPFGFHVHSSKTTDVEEIYRATREAIDFMDKNGMPAFIHCRYHRYLEHVGVSEDYCHEYRCKEDYLEYYDADPLKVQRERLLSDGFAPEELAAVEKGIDIMIKRSIEKAKQATYADYSCLLGDVYA
jgi:pyruvate dehydrogenase E1 component alpha subunit